MRAPMDILREVRAHLGLGMPDEPYNGAPDDKVDGLVDDILYLKQSSQVGVGPFHVWLRRLGKNPYDYPQI